MHLSASCESDLKVLRDLAAEREDLRVRQLDMIGELRETIAKSWDIIQESHRLLNRAAYKTQRQIHQAIKK